MFVSFSYLFFFFFFSLLFLSCCYFWCLIAIRLAVVAVAVVCCSKSSNTLSALCVCAVLVQLGRIVYRWRPRALFGFRIDICHRIQPLLLLLLSLPPPFLERERERKGACLPPGINFWPSSRASLVHRKLFARPVNLFAPISSPTNPPPTPAPAPLLCLLAFSNRSPQSKKRESPKRRRRDYVCTRAVSRVVL
jgi:hypothetical protein